MIDDEDSGKTDKLREIDWGVAENSTNNRQLFFSLCLSLSLVRARSLSLSLSPNPVDPLRSLLFWFSTGSETLTWGG